MNEKKGQKWSREETILAFELYCRTSFGKIGSSNPEIIKLSKLIGRSPSAVSLKMSNLAHFDPVLQARDIKGMSHGSKLDEDIFNEFYQDLENLVYTAQNIIDQNYHASLLEDDLLNDFNTLPPGRDREQMVKARIGQYAFRLAVLNSYNNKCCITGLSVPNMLIASHIKPWKVSDEKTERTNPCNGVCLNAFHDRAFDKGLITIDKDFKIIVSSSLKKASMDDNTKKWLFSYSGEKIILPEKFIPSKEFLEYHNDVIFIG